MRVLSLDSPIVEEGAIEPTDTDHTEPLSRERLYELVCQERENA